MNATEKKTLDGLFCDTVDVKPRDFDFGSGYAETWDTVYPDYNSWDAEECKTWLDNYGYDWDKDSSEEELQEAVFEHMSDSENYCPMMNYIYPLPDLRISPEEAQGKIEDTNCVIVLIDDEPFMALSGGGMDLSWDICTAYMLLGYYPPVHFCDLPNFAGKKLTKTAKWVLDGCRESCRISTSWATSAIEKLDRLEESMKKNS